MPYYLSVVVLTLCFIRPGWSQSLGIEVPPGYLEVLRQADQDSLAPIFSFHTGVPAPIFIPPDLGKQRGWDQHPLDVRRLGQHIILIPGGTGRVYRLNIRPAGMEVMRIDNSQFVGYNFGAYNFLWRDTLFSIGGYGFWKFNGLLRHYDPSAGGWEISPLDTEIPVSGSGSHLGIWVDPEKNQLYYIARNLHHTHLKNAKPAKFYFDDSTGIYQLNLQKRIWRKTGRLNSAFINVISNAIKIAELPDGELIISGPGGSRKVYLCKYGRNEVFQLKEPVAAQLYAVLLGAPEKLSWYSKNILHIGPVEPDTVLHLPIADSLFVRSSFPIYESSEEISSSGFETGLMSLVLMSGCIFGIGLGWLLFRKSASNTVRDIDAAVPIGNLLNPFELKVLRGFMKSDHSLLPEEVNILLETDRKSIEVQKKYRSEAIRGINEKCGKFLTTDERIILQERLADDRRQFIYRLNQELIERLLKKTLGLQDSALVL